MGNYSKGDLQININKDENLIKMSWEGKSEDKNPSVTLDPFFSSLMDELEGIDLVIEFNRLEYMNSATVPPILYLIKGLNSRRIKTRIIYDKNSKWQSVSFRALESITSSMETITVEGN